MSWIFYFLILYHVWKLFSSSIIVQPNTSFFWWSISYIFDLDSSSVLRVKLLLICNKVFFDRQLMQSNDLDEADYIYYSPIIYDTYFTYLVTVNCYVFHN